MKSPEHGLSANSIAAIGTAMLFLAASLLYTHDRLDDPYIGYRYARNLARGHGLVWNVGEPPVEGYTSFLWVVLHAPFIASGISPLLASKLLSTAAGLALIGLIHSPLNLVIGAIVWRSMLSLLVAVCPVFLFYAQSGMDHFFFTVLIFTAVLCWTNSRLIDDGHRYRLSASALFGVAGLTRPEGAFLFGLVWLLELPGRWSRWANQPLIGRLMALTLPFVLIWLPYFLWRWSHYGYLFPNTFYAKHTGNYLANLSLGIDYAADASLSYLLVPIVSMAGVAVFALVRSGGHGHERSTYRIVEPLGALTLAYLGFIVWVGGDDTAAFPSFRLLMPVLPLVWLCLAAVCQHAVQAPPARQAAVGGLLALLCFAAWTPDAIHLGKLSNPQLLATRGRVLDSLQSIVSKAFDLPKESPRALAPWVRSVTPSDALIALPWAGRVAYYADRPALDTLGLNDIHIAHTVSRQTGIDVKMDPGYVLSRRPDLIFVNVEVCYWKGTCAFEEAGGWKLGDREMIALLRTSTDYEFVEDAPTPICVFRRR